MLVSKKIKNVIEINKCKNMKKVFFVGAGPGDPELITRAGWNALTKADIILYDALLDFDGFYKSAPHSKWINVGKRANKISIKQNFIGKILINYCRKGFSVVRLKGGDPSIFGRISEEISVLKKMNILYEVIPGVTAASSAAANLGISLSKRNESRSIAFVTPATSKSSSKDNHWLDTIFHSDTSIIYMGGGDRKKIAKTLISNGMNPLCPIAIVENAGYKKGYKKVMTLNQLALDQFIPLNGPVCLIIGKILLDSDFCKEDLSINFDYLFFNQFEKICYGK